MTRWSVWVAGQDLAQNRCALTVGAAGRTGGILGTELVRTLWAPSLPLGGDMRGGGGEGGESHLHHGESRLELCESLSVITGTDNNSRTLTVPQSCL